MAYLAKILRDSMSPNGVRLTTMEVTFPRIVLAEFNTHRVFSRNSASSRAIPVEKMLQKVKDDPFIPVYWGKNQKGMQAEQELTPDEIVNAQTRWLMARDASMIEAQRLLEIGVHKQITNRLLEPWLWHTVIVTSTEWDNWEGLRCSKQAQPEIKKIADMMLAAYTKSDPIELEHGAWHLPLVDVDEATQILAEEDTLGWTNVDHHAIAHVSAGRCARVSYLTHDGKRDWKADVTLARRLLTSGHMSPFEHVARPMTQDDADQVLGRSNVQGLVIPFMADVKHTFCGNIRGWMSYRKMIPGEDNFKLTQNVPQSIEQQEIISRPPRFTTYNQ